MRRWLLRLRGRWRLFFGFCPACNSDAPELYICRVCNGYSAASGDLFPPDPDTKTLWWQRYKGELTP